MATELVMGLGLFKTMFDLAKGMKDISDATVRNGVAIELQEKILAAQLQQASLIQSIGELEKKVANLEAWETEKQRYQLTDFGGSTFAYALKPEASNGEPAHRLCAACYQKGHKSILQKTSGEASGQEQWKCT